jgi:hypothetical protein
MPIHRCVPLLLALALAAPPSALAQGSEPGGFHPAGSGPITVAVTAAGLHLTMTIPRRTYPLNALVRVTLSLTNVTNHTVALGPQDNGNGTCATSYPQAEVHGAGGKLLFPPAVTLPLHLPCPNYLGMPLAAGKSLVQREYLILRGPRVVAVASTRTGQTFSPITTRPVVLTLTSESPPTATVTKSPLGIDVHSPVAVSGRLHYVSTWTCPAGASSNGESLQAGQWWVSVGGTRITSGCTNPTWWLVAAGWLNHPVVLVKYSTGH